MGSDDQKWFDEVFVSTAPAVRRYILSIYLMFPWLPYDPDDIIQEVYLCLYEKREEIYDLDGLHKWLIKTAQFKTLDAGRDYAKRSRIIDHFLGIDSLKVERATITNIQKYDLKQYLELCEQRIGKENLEYLQRYYVDKESIHTIARDAGVTVPVMRTCFHRWRKYCANLLRDIMKTDLMLILIMILISGNIK